MAETFLQRQQRVRGRATVAPAPTPGVPQAAANVNGPPPAAPAPAEPAQSTAQRQEPNAGYAAPQAPQGGATAASGANRPAPPVYQPPAQLGGQPVRQAYQQPAQQQPAPQGEQRLSASSTPQPAQQQRLSASSQPAPAQGQVQTQQAPAQGQTYNPQQFSQWAQGRYGRAPNAQEMGQIGAAVGAPQGPGGTYTQAQYERGQQVADQLARAQGWNGPALSATPAQPAFGPNSGVDPNVPGNVGHQGRVLVDPGPGYQANQLGAYQRENTGNVGAQNTALMEQILANPESLPPSVVAQMKAAGKTSAARQQEQLRQQASTTLAGRGFSGAGGMQAAADAAVDQNFLESLLDSNRDVDIRASQQNFQDRLAASNAGTQFQNAASQRAIGESGAEVQRFGANEGARQAQSQDQLGRDAFRYGQQQDDRGANLQEWLARQGVTLDNSRFQEQMRQFNQTFGFDVTRFLEDVRQNNRQFGEGQRQFNNQLGFNYNQLDQQGNQNMLNWLLQNGGMG